MTNKNLPINLIRNYIEVLNNHPHLYFNDRVKMIKSKTPILLYDKNNKPYINRETTIESYLREQHINLYERYNYKSEEYVSESPKGYMENLYREIVFESIECLYYLNYESEYLQKLKDATTNKFNFQNHNFEENILQYCKMIKKSKEINDFKLNEYQKQLIDRFFKERNIHIERLTQEFIQELDNQNEIHRKLYVIKFINKESDLDFPSAFLPMKKIWNSNNEQKLIEVCNYIIENIKTKEDSRHYCFELYNKKWIYVASVSSIEVAEIFCKLINKDLCRSNDGSRFNVENPNNFNSRKCRKFKISLNEEPLYE